MNDEWLAAPSACAEPLAIIGLACRFPLAADPAAFWSLVRTGVDAVTDLPAERHGPGWAELPESARRGGYLDHVAEFDAGFFGISPREAAAMDPQQRLALELAWEALEDARIVPAGLRASRSGVFIGAARDDYAGLLASAPVTGHTMTGLSRSLIANRVSYTLGLRGPSLTVDTGQSSSLVSVELAAESLRSGESVLAIAGGVNLNLDPAAAAAALRFGGLSPDGRCATFDADANGFVRGEGGGLVVLKTLARAVEDGDRIYCVLHGGAVNNDGPAEGLTVPDQTAQELLLRKACLRSGVRPADIDYVELHGTGTRVGDPIEAGALGAVFGPGRSAERALLVGSVKTNIGHLESAAGIAGLIKLVLSLANAEIAPSLHFRTPNPKIPLNRLRLRVATESMPWPVRDDDDDDTERPRWAGVSSFGMGGTNCHLVLSSAPVRVETDPSLSPRSWPWVLSGRTRAALRAQAARLAELADSGVDPARVGFALATTRTAFEHRAAVVAEKPGDFRTGLRALAEGTQASGVVEALDSREPGGLAMLFAGQGAQRLGMGRELYLRQPVFAAAFDAIAEHADPRLPRPLREVVWAAPDSVDAGLIDQTEYTQIALFAIEVAQYRLLESWGIRPEFVAGHSVGELAAAHVAGVLNLADACTLLVARGRLIRELPDGGAMVAVQATEAEALAVLDTRTDRAGIAAINGPRSVVVSGTEDVVTEIGAHFTALGRKTTRLAVSHAFHSPLVEPALAEFRSILDGLDFQQPNGIRVVSALTGRILGADSLGSVEHWVRHLREPVRFADATGALYEAGGRIFLELGPGGVLTGLARDVLAERGADRSAVFLTGLGSGSETASMSAALAGLHVNGVEIDWSSVFDGVQHAVDLPTYAFIRERHWLAESGRPVALAPVDGPAAPVQEKPKGRPPLRQRLAGLAASEARRVITELVRMNVLLTLGHVTSETIEGGRSFKDLGFNSLMAVELCTRLSAATELHLPSTLLFDHASTEQLAGHLVAELLGDADVVEPGQPQKTVTAEPIAVIGMGCRYPGGVRSPEDLWQLVVDGVDAITEFPTNRGWDLDALYDPDPEAPGRTYVRHGGFLHDADQFDHEFFGISPREADAMEPQQRLLLEVSWEAMERAGLDPTTLRGAPVGVFVGAMSQDYGPRLDEAQERVAGYRLTGGSVSVASGRISYVHGFVGPAMTVDTACSSSLVALHLAGQALRNGECDLALAGGAAVMATPGMFVEFSKQRGLAEDGRCKAFADAADGTAWAEGAGVLVLERLSDARRNGHQVLAVISGSAVNSDGASNGLTAPSGPSQVSVIRAALAAADVPPAEVDVVEAHGTGTALGDPIEARALLATYGANRAEDRPLLLGSLKSNIGHSQAAAGVGGVIKMVQAIRNGVLPATLHVDRPSSHVDWSAGAVSLLTQPIDWPSRSHPRRAAVSSFGISGTNAHVIIEQAKDEQPARRPKDRTNEFVPLLLSAKSPAALRDQAARVRALLADPECVPADVAYSLATGRTRFANRTAVLGADRAELLAGLDAVVAGSPAGNVLHGEALTGRTVFVFPGQGSQWAGMAVRLLASSPVFAESMRVCGQALAEFVDWSLLAALRGDEGAVGLDRVDVVQPALFAVMVSLAELWRCYGVEPDAVIGHSQGEIAAAYVAGMLSLSDAARVVALRSRAITTLAGTGGMVSVPLPEERVRADLSAWADQIHLAAINGPESSVVAGERDALDRLIADYTSNGVRARNIDVDYASHTPFVRPLREELRETLSGITFHPARIPFYSTVTGEPLDTAGLDWEYWYRNLSSTVRFEHATRRLITDGHQNFLEMSPHPVLTIGVQETLATAGANGVALGSLRRDDGGWPRFVAALAEAHVHGVAIDWPRVFAESHADRVDLPTYPFQGERHWLSAATGTGGLARAGLADAVHPLLGAIAELPGSGGLLMSGRLSLRGQPWLADHAVFGTVVLPGTGLVELALRACAELGLDQVDELVLESPLVLPEDGAVDIRLVVTGAEGAPQRSVGVHSRPADADGESWTRHVTGTLGSAMADAGRDSISWPPADAEPIELHDGYERLAAQGYRYGPVFQGLTSAWRRGEEVFAEVRLPEPAQPDASAFGLHPALLDAALHAALCGGMFPADGQLRLPFSFAGVRLHRGGAGALRVHCVPKGRNAIGMTVTDGAGALVATVDRVVFAVASGAGLASGDVVGSSLFRLDWVETPLAAAPEQPLVVLGGEDRELPGANRYADVAALLADLDERPTPRFVLLDRTALADDPLAETTEVLAVVQDFLAQQRLTEAALVILTRHAVDAGAPIPLSGVASAGIWGLVRSAQSENPGRFVLLDLDGQPESDRAVPAALATGEPSLALRAGRALAPRLARAAGRPELVPPAGDAAWHLDVTKPGTLANLALLPGPDALEPLAPDQVRVRVRAAGVNFRDVIVALGVVPTEHGMGIEGAGEVLEVGSAVTGLRPGDRAFGLFGNAFGPIAVADRRCVVPIPAGWTFSDAAAVPVVFLTAYQGLVHIARLAPGERVLIHAATGGVGMAAVQLARELGAEVFATASPAKWPQLRRMGLDDEHIASSRSLEFEARFGRVDVVLNSLAGDYVDASLRLLGQGGRFAEMGKTDKRDPDQVALDHPGVRYEAFNLPDVPPATVATWLAELLDLFARGALHRPPVRTWDVRRAPEALRTLSQARHIGKIVLTVPVPLDRNGTVLITGGVGTLGSLLARHLVTAHGIRRLALTSRRGMATKGAAELCAELTELGAHVEIHACDAADRDALRALLTQVRQQGRLTAVVHAAGLLDDGLIGTLSPDRLAAVLRPKATGALTLHELTESDDLAAFVMFSSAAGVLGEAGQSNYAAANAVLDALARHRTANGRPATSLAWGLWATASGMTEHLGETELARLRRSGMGQLSERDGLLLFDAALSMAEPVLVPMRLDANSVRTGPEPVPHLLRGVVRPARHTTTAAPSEPAASSTATLAGLPDGERRQALLELVRSETAAVLGHPRPDAVGPEQGFKELGFDSLAAVELRNRLNAATGLRLPSSLVLDAANPVALTEHLHAALGG